MRFIGCKYNILEEIYNLSLEKGIRNGTFYDIFSGTTCVAVFFKKKGFRVISNDLLFFSYVLQKAYIENNSTPTFRKLLKKLKLPDKNIKPLNRIIKYLDSLKGIEGFIYKNYTEEGTASGNVKRMYFQGENGKKVDAIRIKIEEWKNLRLLSEQEYYILLSSLIEAVPFVSNISGTYGAFLKFWEHRTYNDLNLKVPEIIINSHKNKALNEDGVKQCKRIKCDILYIDPPYNRRQYAPNYHILETIARYDNPHIKGVSGLRKYDELKSQFCNKESAKVALSNIVMQGNYKHLIFSYNNEGLLSDNEIQQILSLKGNIVEKRIVEYRRFKSHNRGINNHKRRVEELLYYVRGKLHGN